MIGERERRAVDAVLQGHVLTHGSRVREFEAAFARYTGAPHAVATASCTAAMQLAYMHLGIGPDDEVIVPAQTHVGTAHAVELCGAQCVFVDSEPMTGNIDLDEVEALVSDRTRALAVVHYLGVPVDMDRVMDIAERHELFVVEDCALALGAKHGHTHVGLMGDVGCFSFYPVKHITTAEGGMLITRHAELAERAAAMRAFGIDRHDPERRDIPGEYDVALLGANFRLNEMGAAIGVEQLKRLPDFLGQRRANYGALRSGLGDVEQLEFLDPVAGDYQQSYYCLVVLLRDSIYRRRPEIIQQLRERGVGTSIYYPKPVPQMSYYRDKYRFSEDRFPVASRISLRSLALPVGPHLNVDDIDYMVNNVAEVLGQLE